jgi:hypothetical protein
MWLLGINVPNKNKTNLRAIAVHFLPNSQIPIQNCLKTAQNDRNSPHMTPLISQHIYHPLFNFKTTFNFCRDFDKKIDLASCAIRFITPN